MTQRTLKHIAAYREQDTEKSIAQVTGVKGTQGRAIHRWIIVKIVKTRKVWRARHTARVCEVLKQMLNHVSSSYQVDFRWNVKKGRNSEHEIVLASLEGGYGGTC